MKILVGMHGQYGDQFIQLPFIEYLKKLYPDSYLVKNVNKKYVDAIPTLSKCPCIDNFFVSNNYENFPGDKWEQEYLDEQKFDIVFPAMPRHKDSQWFLKHHQTTEVFDMFGYKSPEEKYQINLNIGKARVHNGITFAPFAGFYNKNNNKKLSREKAQRIVDYINEKRVPVLQIGGKDEPNLVDAYRTDCSYLKSLQFIKGSKLFIHTDTGTAWASSGWKQKSLGLYSNEGYGAHIKNIQPVNPNSCYLDARLANEISDEQIFEKIDEILK